MKLVSLIFGTAILLTSTSAAQKLDGKVAYRLKNATRSLDRSEAALKKEDLRQAKIALQGAEREWKLINTDYKGRFNENHPEIVATRERLRKIGAQVKALEHEAAVMGEKLGSLLAALEQNHELLKADLSTVRQKILRFSSALREFEQDHKTERFEAVLSELAVSADRIHAVLPGAREAVRKFRKQYPDLRSVKKLVKDGGKAVQSLERLERFPAAWDQVRRKATTEAITKIERIAGRYETSLRKLAHEKESTKKVSADQAESIAVDLNEVLIRYARALQQRGGKPIGATAPALSDEATLARLDKLETRVQKLRRVIATLRNEAVAEEKLRLKNVRFPNTKFQGGDWTAAEAEVKKAYQRFAPKHLVRRIAILSPWQERAEVTVTEDTWKIITCKYLGATLCAKLEDGRFRVYRLSLRKKQAEDGSFGSLEVAGVGGSREILEENIDK